MTFLVRCLFSARVGSRDVYIHPLLAGEYVAPRPGPILAVDTNIVLGQHGGLWTYTIGQGARLPGLARKLFVAAKDRRKNAIYVALPELVPSFYPTHFVS